MTGMTRKAGSLLLALAMVLTLIPFASVKVNAQSESWVYTATEDDETWRITTSIPTSFTLNDSIPEATNATVTGSGKGRKAWLVEATAESHDYQMYDDSYWSEATGTFEAGKLYAYAIMVSPEATITINDASATETGKCTINGITYHIYTPIAGSVDENGTFTKYVEVGSINITSETSVKDGLEMGKTVTLTATVSPSNATYPSVTWSSNDKTVATVSSTGVVEALKPGWVTIIATATRGSTYATYRIQVTGVSVTGVALDTTSETLTVGDAKTLIATVSPSNASNQAVTWTSSDETVASVDENGKVTALKAGEATITVTTTDGSKKATCEVTVQEEKEDKTYEDIATKDGQVNDITGSKEATAEKNTLNAAIINTTDLEKLVGVTSDEKAAGVNVWLEIVDGSTIVSDTDKSKIEEKSDNYTVGMYLDVNLFKKVGTSEATKVSKTEGDAEVEISFVVPESLRASGRTYEIIRVHDDVASVIEGSYDETSYTFTFKTSQFSSYAIAYKDSSPETGDDTNLGILYMLLLVAGTVLVFAGVRKRA